MKHSFISNSCYVRNGSSKLYVKSKLEHQKLKGKIYLSNQSSSPLEITSEKAHYDSLCAIKTKLGTFCLYALYENSCRSFYLSMVNENALINTKLVKASGKIANPSMIEKEGKLFIVFEEYDSIYTDLKLLEIDQTTLTITEETLTKNQRAYCGSIIECKDRLFLAYESFFDFRYHIMMKEIGANQDSFEIGTKTQNDKSPKLTVHEDAIYVVWENSSPLYKNYEWQPGDPSLPLVIMPSFGHGWRVYSNIHIAKVTIEEEIVSVSNCMGKEFLGDALDIAASETAGEAQIFILNHTLFVLYVDFHTKNYSVKLAFFNNNAFVDIPLSVDEVLKREHINFRLNEECLELSLLNPGEDLKDYSLDLSSYKGQVPEFIKTCEYNITQLVKTPCYTEEKRITEVFGGEPLQLFWGDLHMHSNISECSKHTRFHCTEVEEKHRFSRDVGGLDFCLLTDHDSMNQYEWLQTKQYADFNNIEGSFVSFLGLEWTCTHDPNTSIGHYNILYLDDGINLPVKYEYPSIEDVWNTLKVGEAMTIPHHTGELQHLHDWKFYNSEFERLVEVYQVRGSYEYDECEFNPIDYGRPTKMGSSVQAGLKRGYKFGFTSGGEHEGVGITGVYAKSLTRKDIFDALYERRTFGTTSEKLSLSYFADNTCMGGETKKGTKHIHGSLNLTDPLEYIKLVTNLEEIDITAATTSCNFSATIDLSNVDWAYIRIKQKDSNIAWSSPIFFD